MIIVIIYQNCVLALKGKGQTPIAANIYGAVSLEFTF